MFKVLTQINIAFRTVYVQFSNDILSLSADHIYGLK